MPREAKLPAGPLLELIERYQRARSLSLTEVADVISHRSSSSAESIARTYFKIRRRGWTNLQFADEVALALDSHLTYLYPHEHLDTVSGAK